MMSTSDRQDNGELVDDDNTISNSMEDDRDDGSADDDIDTGDDVVASLDEPEPETDDQEPAPQWVKDLRKEQQSLRRENYELRKRLGSTEQAPTDAAKDPGPKPKLEDYDYYADSFEEALDAWYQKKHDYDQASRQQQQHKTSDWEQHVQRYNDRKGSLSAKDFEDSELLVIAALDDTQRGLIVKGCDDAPRLVYALGKSPKMLDKLAHIKDPVTFVKEITRLEGTMRTKTKSPPPPERTITGDAPVTGSVNSRLDRLRREAERTGDYTKVVDFKRKLREKR